MCIESYSISGIPLCMYGFAFCRHFTQMELYNNWSFVTGFFHISKLFFNVFSWCALYHYCIFLLINNSPLCENTVSYLFIQQLMEIWVISISGPYKLCCYVCVQVFVVVYPYFSWVCTYLWWELLNHMTTLFNLLRKCQTVSQNSCTI